MKKALNKAWNNVHFWKPSTYPSTIWDTSSASYARAELHVWAAGDHMIKGIFQPPNIIETSRKPILGHFIYNFSFFQEKVYQKQTKSDFFLS